MLDAQIVISVKDILFTLLFVIAAIGVSYLIFCLREMYIAIKNINQIYADNKDSINKLIINSADVVEKSNLIMDGISTDLVKISDGISEFSPIINLIITFIKSFILKK